MLKGTQELQFGAAEDGQGRYGGIGEYLKNHLFGAIFARDNLDRQSRELASVGALAAVPGVESQLQSHIGISMNVGLTATQPRHPAKSGPPRSPANSALSFKSSRQRLTTIIPSPLPCRSCTMNLSPRFARRIRPFVQDELDAAARHRSLGEFGPAFARLERAHVLGQASTVEHVRVHWAMLRWALEQRAASEILGQAWRTVGALLKTWLWVPVGNTGGASVSGLKPMPVTAELQRLIDFARG